VEVDTGLLPRITVQVYIKSHMTKAYIKRFQVKYRWRRGQSLSSSWFMHVAIYVGLGFDSQLQ
jgi:hypothetical protein